MSVENLINASQKPNTEKNNKKNVRILPKRIDEKIRANLEPLNE